MKRIGDDELRACFHKLRDHDAANLPAYPALTTPRARRSPTPLAVWFGAAACLVIGVPSALWFTRDRLESPSIATWRSPTAELLDVRAVGLLAPAPILSSVLDGVTRLAIPKGD